ncbi:MAG: acetate--CoA ligase family protein [Patescibacteria group bacterium]
MTLKSFLAPKSIALIGASNNKKKLGWQILSNLKAGGFRGKIYPVNLKEKNIAGLRAYSSIKDIKTRVDLAVIVIPAAFVISEVKNCAARRIKNIIIISSGFAEVGAEGKIREEELKGLIAKYKLNLLGPNCLGLISSASRLNLTFARAKVKSGGLAFISQSGAIGSAALDWLYNKNIGFSYFISLGNKVGLKENDFFEFLAKDKNTRFIVAYLEEIEEGGRLMEIVSRLAKRKPVAILKAGKTKTGAQAALSHTGSLAGSYGAVATGLERAGAMNISNLEEMFSLIKIWQEQTKSENGDLYIVSNAGGPLVMTADLLEENNLALGKFSPELTGKIKRGLPEVPNPVNPLDILGDAGAERYEKALKIILGEKNAYNLLVLLTPQTSTEAEATAKVIGRLGKKYPDKLICTSFIGGESLAKARKILRQDNIVNFSYPEQAVKILGKFLNYQIKIKNLKPYTQKHKNTLLRQGFEGQAKTQKRFLKDEQMDYLKSFRLLKKYKIPAAKTIVIENKNNLKKLKYPIVLKMVGPEIIHKTDKNDLVLNIVNAKQAEKAFKSFKAKGENYCVAQEMVKDGLEIILGFKRDKYFGPIIMVGTGGIYTEVWQDIALEVDDVDYARALEMIKKLKIYPILRGARGQAGYDIKNLAKAIVKVASLARENPEIKEVDINPLFIKREGAVAADARIIV